MYCAMNLSTNALRIQSAGSAADIYSMLQRSVPFAVALAIVAIKIASLFTASRCGSSMPT